jgi:hypothetical protein
MFGISRMEGNTEHRSYKKNKNSTSGIKTTYVATDIGSRIFHTPSCEKKITEKMFLSIFKIMLNAERCSVLPSSCTDLSIRINS